MYKKVILHNKIDGNELKKQLHQEPFERTTLSFYRYVGIANPQEFRDGLYIALHDLNCFGRIYVAYEGINAQMNVPTHHYDQLLKTLDNLEPLRNIPIKIAIEDNGKSFYKLNIKTRNKIVADGLDDPTFDSANVGTHLNAQQFNQAMALPQTLVVDMRNHYESEIGYFQNAICPDVDAFKDALSMVAKLLDNQQDKKILLYCTGGIRCEKASAYLKHKGFLDVNQLYGGIVQYTQEAKQQGLENKFIGKNFVFDERLAETINDQIISQCHQCQKPANTHTNCAFDPCHILFIQCDECQQKYQNCCSDYCNELKNAPLETQTARRAEKEVNGAKNSEIKINRLRPNINDKPHTQQTTANTVFLQLGSNQHNRAKYLTEAQQNIEKNIGNITKQSTIYQTEAWGNTNQQAFLNQVIQIQTTLSPNQLLKKINQIENQMGRIRTQKWAERTIDIDILLFNNEIINQENLTIPHLLMQDRRFVLIPLNEIAPQQQHPVYQKTIEDLLTQCPDKLDVQPFVET